MTNFLKVKILKCYISETGKASTKICGDICKFLHWPSNGVIVKVLLFDFDRLFEGKKIFFMSETVRASAKMCGRHLHILTFALEWCRC